MSSRRLAGVFVCVVSVALGFPQAAKKEPPRSGLFTLKRAGQGVVVLDWDRSAVRAAARRKGRTIVPRFPLSRETRVDLELEPFSITGPDSLFVLGRKDGPDEPLVFDPSSVSLFRGRVAGSPGSRVILALSDSRAAGQVDLGPGRERYHVKSIDERGERLGAHEAALYPVPLSSAPSGPPPGVPLCGVEHGSTTLEALHPSPVPNESLALTGPLKGLKHLQLAVETDHEFFLLFGNTGDAMTYLIQMYAHVSDIYIRDADTRVELSFVRLWDDGNDLFNDVEPSPLSEFRNYWNTNMGGVTRDAAQLLSGRRDYPFGGQAYLSALCGSNAYSVVGYALGFSPDPSIPDPYSYDIFVTAHELGHNAGTGHTHDSPNNIDTCNDPMTIPQRGTIMSYCSQTWSGMNANGDLYFHSRVQQNLDAHIGSVSCVVDDCNQNSVPDQTDIAMATSADANLNDVPDECEDCNTNMILDDVDIAMMTSLDLNSNGVPDECEPDCNANGIPDEKDITDMTSADLHGNDIPDECEPDCDTDLVSDYTEIQADMTLDVDRDTILDACQDCDTDGTPDLEELDGAHHVWVASGLTGSAIRQFHPGTGVLTRVSGGGAGSLANEAQDLIVAPGGNILVTSGVDSRVMEFGPDGVYLGDLVPSGSGGLSGPRGLTVTPDGMTLLVTSSNNASVLAYDASDGTSLGPFVASGSGGLSSPFGLVFGPSGNLFVTSGDHEVLEYDGQSGAFVGVFVDAADSGGLDQPRGMAFKPDGNLLVASFGTDRVLEYDGQTGAALGRWAISGTADRLTQTSPWGVRVAPNGNVFVARTGEDHGSGGGNHDHGDLHLTNAQIYEFDGLSGLFIRTYIGGNDHGLEFPTGFDFVPGWGIDCNLNDLQDSCDISLGFSPDLDMNQIPDECDADCNMNSVADRLDVIPYGTDPDCNGNLSPDSCDIAAMLSSDCTGNGVPDECETDCNKNFVADSCEIASGAVDDCNGNGVPDECDVTDDLETDTGWTSGDPNDTATTGIWIRDIPLVTPAQTWEDHTPGAGERCFVTGQGTIGGSIGENDVDGGRTTLFTPILDLTGPAAQDIGYWRWFYTTGSTGEDVLQVDISDDGGATWASVETVDSTGPEAFGGWFFHRFRVADITTPTGNMMIRFVASDLGPGSIVEAAIDDLVILPACCASALDCDDGLSCTADTCGLTGACSNNVQAGSCLIGGSCHIDGAVNPMNDCQECDAASPLDWAAVPPVEVTGLLVSQDGMTHLSWDQQGAAVYDLLSGSITEMLAAGDVGDALCAADDQVMASWDDPGPDPPAGGGTYYLVRSEKSCGAGTYGTSSSGAPRLPDTGCP